MDLEDIVLNEISDSKRGNIVCVCVCVCVCVSRLVMSDSLQLHGL